MEQGRTHAVEDLAKFTANFFLRATFGAHPRIVRVDAESVDAV
jgi:hypothetical protein